MNRDPDSQVELSAGRKKTVTPTQRERGKEMEVEDEDEDEDERKTERSIQRAAGLTVCTASFSGEGEPLSCNEDAKRCVFMVLYEKEPDHKISLIIQLPSNLEDALQIIWD